LALGSLPTPLLGRGRHDAHKLDRLAPSAQRYGGVDVEAPLIRVSWEDVGSGVLALFATVVVFGLGTERREAAVRVVGAAAIAGLVATIVDVFV
jgi:hypothetical protein